MNEPDEHVREPETPLDSGQSNFTRYMIGGLCLVLFLALTGVGYIEVEERRGGGLRPFISAENKRCIDCHTTKDVAVGGINDWKVSRHAPKGIGCIECHRAEKDEADAYDHEGFMISTLVTPKPAAYTSPSCRMPNAAPGTWLRCRAASITPASASR